MLAVHFPEYKNIKDKTLEKKPKFSNKSKDRTVRRGSLQGGAVSDL